MKRNTWLILISCTIALSAITGLQALARRQAAPQARSQNVRMRQNLTRSPSMSRIDPLPAGSTQRQNAVQNRATAREQVNQYVQKAPQMNQAMTQKQRDFQKKFSQYAQANKQAARQVQSLMQNNYPGIHSWFNDQFFTSHRYTPPYYRQGQNWWRAARWGTMNSWLAWGWGYPIYYDVEGVPIEIPSETAYSYDNYPQEERNQGNWLPLGVFAVGKNSTQVSYSNMIIQLALNKQGTIAGTYYNAATDQTYSLEGLVDKKSQQAVWKLSDDPDSPLMTTGLYNLSQDSSPVRMLFPDGTQQMWAMVRLNP